jgi:hypothetical protein
LKPEFSCNTEIFQTLVSNLPAPEDGSFMSDLDGVNIAGDNLYSELRHQFFVWKNLMADYDYIGFEHYRRPFFIDPVPADQLIASFPDMLSIRRYFMAMNSAGMRQTPDMFERYLSMRRSFDAAAIARAREWIGGYDIVVPRPNCINIEKQWKHWFPADNLWDTMVEGIRLNPMFRDRLNYIFFQTEVCWFANMYIMRGDLLDEYLTFCFQVLDYCHARLPVTGRALGYYSERVFTFWLYQKRIEQPTLRVLELPILMLETGFVSTVQPSLIETAGAAV